MKMQLTWREKFIAEAGRRAVFLSNLAVKQFVVRSEKWSSQLISNLSNWKEEAWKNQGFNGIRTRDLRDTGAMLYQLSYEATHWERGQFIEFIYMNYFIYTSRHFTPQGR